MAFPNASRAPTCDDWYEIYPCDWPLTAESNCTMTIAETLGTPYDAFSLFIGLTCAYLLGYWSLRFLEIAPALRRKLGLSGKNPSKAVLMAEAKLAKQSENERHCCFLLAVIYATLALRSVDYNAYRGAWRIISNASNDLTGKAEGGQQAFDAWRAAQLEKGSTLAGSAKENFQETWAEAPVSLAEWLAVDRESLAMRLRVMRRQLAPEHHALLDELSAAADAVVVAKRRGGGRAEQAA